MRVGRILWVLLAVVIAGLTVFLVRPGATHSPLAMNRLFHPDDRVENHRNMDRIFPAETIAASSRPRPFAENPAPLALDYRHDGEPRQLDEFLQRVNATALLVIRDDTIVHERYRLGADAGSRFTSWSVAKSFIATLVGMTVREGRIRSLDDPISDHAPALRGTAYDGVPIRHVLQMASGIDFDETYDDRLSDINRFFWKLFVFGRRAHAVIGDYERAGPSGQAFDYVSLDTQALAMALTAIHGKPIPRLVEERLWQPLGMEASAFWNVDRAGGDAVAFCCLNATARDFAKLGRLYLAGGRVEEQALLPDGWTVEATRPSEPWLQAGAPGLAERGYQYQWWSPPNPDGEYFAAGVWGQYVYVSEPDRLIIVRHSVDPAFRRHMGETVTVFRAIRDHYRARDGARDSAPDSTRNSAPD